MPGEVLRVGGQVSHLQVVPHAVPALLQAERGERHLDPPPAVHLDGLCLIKVDGVAAWEVLRGEGAAGGLAGGGGGGAGGALSAGDQVVDPGEEPLHPGVDPGGGGGAARAVADHAQEGVLATLRHGERAAAVPLAGVRALGPGTQPVGGARGAEVGAAHRARGAQHLDICLFVCLFYKAGD